MDLDDEIAVYLHQGTSDTRYDINYDGTVDEVDLNITHENQFT